MTDSEKILDLVVRLKKDSKRIQDNAQKNITPVPALLSIEGNEVIHVNTINAVQGKTGVHKSRLVEIIDAVLLNPKSNNAANLTKLDFSVNKFVQTTTLYVDTERNIRDQFPFAVQQIHRVAGLPEQKISKNFIPISLIGIERALRMQVLKKFVEIERNAIEGHLLIILDVVTDCVDDINSSHSATAMIDWMNLMCDEHNVTFIAIIHENPNSDKARGHIGTEIYNKATTQIQIKFDDYNAEGERIFEIVFKKTRNTENLDSIFVKYDTSAKTLVRQDKEKDNDKGSDGIEDKVTRTIIKEMETLLIPEKEVSRTEICETLSKKLGIQSETIARKLRALINSEQTFNNVNGRQKLDTVKNGKQVNYVTQIVESTAEVKSTEFVVSEN